MVILFLYYSAENLSFYVDVNNFYLVDDDKVEETAKGIISKYVENGSLFEINIDHKTRSALLKSDKYSKNMFDDALVSTISFKIDYINLFQKKKREKLWLC